MFFVLGHWIKSQMWSTEDVKRKFRYRRVCFQVDLTDNGDNGDLKHRQRIGNMDVNSQYASCIESLRQVWVIKWKIIGKRSLFTKFEQSLSICVSLNLQ